MFLEGYLGKSIINFLSFLKRHWEEFKDDMPSDAIGESNNLETNSIFSPSMPILNVFEPILDPNKSLYAPSTKLHNDPRNPSRHPKNRIMKIIGIPKKSNDNSRNT